MRVLLLNQFFHPDLSATAQLATDLAEDLVASGAEVTAVAGRGSYLGGELLPARGEHRGIAIRRLAVTSFGKRTLLHRGLDYASFYAAAALELARLPRFDAAVVLTTPPLVSGVGLLSRALRGTPLVCWVQDLYPEVAVAMGVLGPRSPLTAAMRAASRAVLGRADALVVLGEAMRARVVEAGARAGRVRVVQNWADGAAVAPVPHAENPLRRERLALFGPAAAERCVVMYSGNMGHGHDLETLVAAARRLRDRDGLGFLFVGHGVKRPIVERAARELPNLRLEPYAPRELLGQSLSSGDLHLASLAPAFLGLVEPSKVYGVMAAGRPTVFVGPPESEVAQTLERADAGALVRPGDVEGLAAALTGLCADRARREALGRNARAALVERYDRKVATARWREVLEEVAARR